MKWLLLLFGCLFLYLGFEHQNDKEIPDYKCLGLFSLEDLRVNNYSAGENLQIYETYAILNGKEMKLISGEDWSTGGSLKVPSKVYLFELGSEQYCLGSSNVISLDVWEDGRHLGFWVAMFLAAVFLGLFFYFLITKEDQE